MSPGDELRDEAFRLGQPVTDNHYDQLETRDPAQRELAQFNLLPGLIRHAMSAPGWARHLQGTDPAAVSSRAELARLPVLRKSALKDLQTQDPPFAGFATSPAGAMARVYMSPGPIFEPEGYGEDWWRTARALFAAGIRKGDIVHNTFAYHLTPGGWIFDSGARALGCAVIAAGPGNTEQQLEVIQTLKPPPTRAFRTTSRSCSTRPARPARTSPLSRRR
jgi:phenylacetate-CoA ligase